MNQDMLCQKEQQKSPEVEVVEEQQQYEDLREEIKECEHGKRQEILGGSVIKKQKLEEVEEVELQDSNTTENLQQQQFQEQSLESKEQQDQAEQKDKKDKEQHNGQQHQQYSQEQLHHQELNNIQHYQQQDLQEQELNQEYEQNQELEQQKGQKQEYQEQQEQQEQYQQQEQQEQEQEMMIILEQTNPSDNFNLNLFHFCRMFEEEELIEEVYSIKMKHLDNKVIFFCKLHINSQEVEKKVKAMIGYREVQGVEMKVVVDTYKKQQKQQLQQQQTQVRVLEEQGMTFNNCPVSGLPLQLPPHPQSHLYSQNHQSYLNQNMSMNINQNNMNQNMNLNMNLNLNQNLNQNVNQNMNSNMNQPINSNINTPQPPVKFNPLQENNLKDVRVRQLALNCIFVKDLSSTTQPDELRDFFLQFGDIQDVWLGSEPSLNLYFAYLLYRTREQAEASYLNCQASPFLIQDAQPTVSLFLHREINKYPQPQQIQQNQLHANFNQQNNNHKPLISQPNQQQQLMNNYNKNVNIQQQLLQQQQQQLQQQHINHQHHQQQPLNLMIHDNQNKSLYVKNLPPYLAEDQLRLQLAQIFGKFGSLLSIMIKVDPTLKRPYAFINFEHYEHAEHSLRLTNNQDIFNTGMPLFVSWAERKMDRMERIKQQQNIQLPIMHSANSNPYLMHQSTLNIQNQIQNSIMANNNISNITGLK